VGQAAVARTALARSTTGPDRLSLEGLLFVSPALLIMIVFIAIPAIWIFVLSVYKWDLISSEQTYVGWANFDRLLKRDDLFRQSVLQTCYFVAVSVPAGMALALGLAVLLHAGLPGRSLLRAAIFSPYVTPPIATLSIWLWMFNPDYGLFDAGLQAVHLPKLGWHRSSDWIMPAIIIYSVWAHTGVNLVVFLAGLSNIPAEMLEAARVDGANAWQSFWRVTWPLLAPTTYFVLIISIIGSFKVFVPALVFGGSNGTGGPNHAALTIGLYLYQQAFQFFHAGYGGAISVVFFLIILAVTALQARVVSGRVFYR
jgi:ABC-type sugar transport system permease subunit